MKIWEHNDRSVFERYNIVSHDDVMDAGRQLQKALAPIKLPRAHHHARRSANLAVGVWWEF